MSLLDIRNISVNFGGLQALKDVTLSVEKGSISSLIGPNGAGKTTLFNCISCFIPIAKGEIIFDNNAIHHKRTHELADVGISRTFQNIRLLQGMTVLENVRLGQHIRLKQSMLDALIHSRSYKQEEKQSIQDAEEILDFVGLLHLKDERADSLPYGSRRKLEIARAIITGARLLMFDEPCAGMNSAEKEMLMKLIFQIREHYGRTIFVIEHDMRFIMNISDTITVLNQGIKIAQGTPDEVQHDPLVIEAYLGSGRK